MLKIDEATMEGSTWNKSDVNEPVFILRGQDLLAPATIRCWAAMARTHGVPGRKIQDALRLANEMESWHGDRKIPD